MFRTIRTVGEQVREVATVDACEAGYSDAISTAFSCLPRTLARRLEGTHFLTGTDPAWAGLHQFRTASYGRSYSDTAHVAYPLVQGGLPWGLRRTTIVLPVPEIPWVIVHELGHILDEQLDFRFDFPPVSDYARTNRYEAFACAFTDWIWGDPIADEKTRVVLDSICLGW